MSTRRRALLLPFLTLALLGAGGPAGEAGIDWYEDYGKLLKAARAEDRIILIDFYTAWCTFCKTLDKESFTDPEIVALASDFACAKLDADVQKAAASRYSPEGYPTLIFATPRGEEILRVSGYRKPNEIYSVFKKVHEVGPRISEQFALLEKNRKDLEARETLGRLYLEIGAAEAAREHLGKALKLAAKAGGAHRPGTECDVARILFLQAQAEAEEEDYNRASRTLEELLEDHRGSPRRGAYLTRLEEVYEAWGKTDLAETARSERLSLEPAADTSPAPGS